MQPQEEGFPEVPVREESQSPYGAMWFATFVKVFLKSGGEEGSQSPYGAMWFATDGLRVKVAGWVIESQSPYGAMWFATGPSRGLDGKAHPVAIPLRGYVVCNEKGGGGCI